MAIAPVSSPNALTIGQAAEQLRARSLSPVELTQAYESATALEDEDFDA